MRWFSRTKFSKASWPPFWLSAIRRLSSGAIRLSLTILTIEGDKSFEKSAKLENQESQGQKNETNDELWRIQEKLATSGGRRCSRYEVILVSKIILWGRKP